MPNVIDVVFALRSDTRQKFGGDMSKVDKYRDSLHRSGWATAVAYSPADVRLAKARIVHLLNIDLPLENIAYAKAARSVGSRVVLSTIAHPLAGLRGLYELSGDRVFQLLRSAGLGFDRGFTLKELAKRITRRQGSLTELGWPALSGFIASQRALLAQVDLILPQNMAEHVELQQRFDDLPRHAVVPNGTTFAESVRRAGAVRYDVAIVGRAEPRKNTLELARILAPTDLRVVFVGALSTNHQRYADEFRRIVSRSENLTWTGQIPRSEVRQILAQSETYINGAWCEISSQADVEASSQRCRVVTTRHCFIQEHLDNVVTIDPAVLSSPQAESGLLQAVADAQVPRMKWLPSWDDAAAALVSGYETV